MRALPRRLSLAAVVLALLVALVVAVRAEDAIAALGVAALVVALHLSRDPDLTRLRSLKAGAVEIVLTDVTEKLEAAVEEASVEDDTPPGGLATASGYTIGPPPGESRRDEIERIVRYSARWGYLQGASGMWSAPPEPIIQWNRGGGVRILAGKGPVAEQLPHDKL